ncbi:tyrosine-type recombinase/integrase [Thalassospira profundimaris]|uniref:tyrosine-type recombinase/integrase n=1 Tax=Thalassospira profundimaris TaxID=502049 RepID=UPI0002871CB3|nr:tyrosine-type recombinase/integrase [Thalassospira profundimaris]EKF10082.1 integrase family protein [Thalassospira profundimaris WP0211]
MGKPVKRPGKNNYEIQYPLPQKLRQVMRTSAIYRSLGTADLSTAKKLYPVRLAEVQAEVTRLLAKHFPDDQNVLQELQDLVTAYKGADDDAEPGSLSEKDILLDLVSEWGTKQRLKRIEAFKASPQHKAGEPIPVAIRQAANEIQVQAERFANDALNPRTKIDTITESWRKANGPKLSVSTREEYERAIKRFSDWCARQQIEYYDQITRRKVREFVEETYHGKMGKTANLALSGLRGVWKHAMTGGFVEEKSTVWDDHEYPDHIRIGTGEIKAEADEEAPFSFEDIETLLTKLDPPLFADVLRLSLVTGGRSAEITALEWKHITKEEDGYWVSLPGTKTKSARRRVPIPVTFTPLMERLTSKPSGRWVFPFYPKLVFETDKKRHSYINKEFNRKRRNLNMPNGKRQGLHSARRTYIELLEGADVAVGTIKLLVGHKRHDITIGRYTKGQYVDLRAASNKLTYPSNIVTIINATNSKKIGPL